MKGLAVSLCLLACAAAAPAAARAAPVSGAITGRITDVGVSTLTVQTGGPRIGAVNALTRAADELSAATYHLAGAGLIARGPGKAPNSVNLYDHPGVQIFMNINGRYFGTSDGGGGNRHGGPTWLDDSAPLSYDRAYHRWHFLPGVLRNHVIYGHSYTFQTSTHPELLYGAELGDTVRAVYVEWPTGSMGLRALGYSGAVTATGTVTALTGSSLTLQSASGRIRVFDVSLVPNLLSGVQIGSGVEVKYSRDDAGRLVPHALKITSPPPPPPPVASPAPPTPPAPGPPAPAGGQTTPGSPSPAAQ